MVKTALCIHCGSFKRTCLAKCESCGFLPESDEDIAKSRILDTPWTFSFGKEGDVVETGRSLAELKEISEQIKTGTPYRFPEEELQGVLHAYRELKQTTPRQFAIALIKWLAPPVALGLLFLAVLLWAK